MPEKRKNDDSAIERFEQSWGARLQRRIGWTSTHEVIVEAEPRHCLAWMKILPEGSGMGQGASCIVQDKKHPYQFKARLITQGRSAINLGDVVGEVVPHPTHEGWSLVILRGYHFHAYALYLIFALFLLPFAGGSIIVWLDTIFKTSEPSYPAICLFPCLVLPWFGMLVFCALGLFITRDEGCQIVQTYLLQLHTRSQDQRAFLERNLLAR